MNQQRKVIQFSPKKRILDKILKYLESKELFLDEKETAVPLLLRALEHADIALKQKIILLLGGFAKDEVAWPLYRILSDYEEDDEIRYIAAIQLRVVFPSLENPQPLIDRLLKDLKSDDSDLRVYAASGLGWKGNYQAAIPLIELLFDSDMDVMQAAVNSLTDLGDDRIYNLLLDRLEHGPIEQKRCILFNLWHLSSKQAEVIEVYLEHLQHENPEIRYDALVLLQVVTEPGDCLDAYCNCLRDEDSRIRLLALERLAELKKDTLATYKNKIHEMVSDPDMEVQETARKIMNRLSAGIA